MGPNTGGEIRGLPVAAPRISWPVPRNSSASLARRTVISSAERKRREVTDPPNLFRLLVLAGAQQLLLMLNNGSRLAVRQRAEKLALLFVAVPRNSQESSSRISGQIAIRAS
jgi:hypothetical protein